MAVAAVFLRRTVLALRASQLKNCVTVYYGSSIGSIWVPRELHLSRVVKIFGDESDEKRSKFE